jgi:hypothetical protein
VADEEHSSVAAEMESGDRDELEERTAAARAAWDAHKARMKELAARVCSQHHLRDADLLADRLIVAYDEMYHFKNGEFLISLGESGDFITDKDRAEIQRVRKASVKLLDLIEGQYNAATWSPEAQELRRSLKAHIKSIDSIVYNRRIGTKGRRRDPVFFLVHRVGLAWPMIAGREASAQPNQITGERAKFCIVLEGICDGLGIKRTSDKSVERYLNLAKTENSPWKVQL